LFVQSPADITKRWTLILCCLAQFMVILDVSVVNVALPSIRDDLGFSVVDLQWVVNAYTITFAGFLLLGGRAADLLGHKKVLLAGLMLFAAASLAGGLSQGQGQLIVARAFQGLGGAVVAPATLSILTTTFTEGAERNRALSVWGAMGAAGGAAGALIGGLLTDVLGWQWILFINVPIGIVAVFAGQRFIVEHAREVGHRHYDALGAVTVTAGLMLLTFGIVSTDQHGWGSPQALVPMAIGLVLLGVFLAIEGRFSPRPLMPLRVFSVRSLSAANIVVFFLGCAVFAMWYFASLYMQQVLGYSPIKTGVAFLPMTAAIAAAATLAGRLSSRVGPGIVLTGGMTLVALGMAGFSFIDAGGGYWSDVFVPSVVTATGLGFSFVPVTIAGMAGVRREEAGLASGLINTSRQFGGSLGLAVLATIASTRASSLADGGHTAAAALTGGFSAAFWVGAGFAAMGALAAGVGLARMPARQPEPVPQNA
jgi:EmrB/QacA subfamily drug resistance transporter